VQLQENHSVTIALSCAIIGLNRCAYYYQPKLPDDSVIMSVLSAITDKYLRCGFPKCFNRIESSAINGIINVSIEYTAS
jgi:putative transposase